MAQNNRKVTMTFDADTKDLVSKIKTATENTNKSLNTVKTAVSKTNTELSTMTKVHFPRLQAIADETSRKIGNLNVISQNGFTGTKARLDKVVTGLSEMTVEARFTVAAIDKLKLSSDAFGTSLTQVTKSNTALLSKMTQQMDQFQKKMSSGGGRGNRGETGTSLDLYINAAKLRLFAGVYKTLTGFLDETAGSAVRTSDALVKLTKTTGENFYTLETDIVKLAKATGTTSEEIVNLAQKMSGYGKTLSKDFKFFNDVLVLTSYNGRNAEENFKDLIEITGAFNLSSSKVVNTLKALNIQTENDIRSVAKLSREAKEAGASFNTLTGILAVLKGKGIGVGEEQAESLKRVFDGAQKLGIPFDNLIGMLDSIKGKTQSIKDLEEALGLKPNDVGLNLLINNLKEVQTQMRLAGDQSHTTSEQLGAGYTSIAQHIMNLAETIKHFFTGILVDHHNLVNEMIKGTMDAKDQMDAEMNAGIAGIVSGIATVGAATLAGFSMPATAIAGIGATLIGNMSGVDILGKLGYNAPTEESTSRNISPATARMQEHGLLAQINLEKQKLEIKLASVKVDQDGNAADLNSLTLLKQAEAIRKNIAKLEAERIVKLKENSPLLASNKTPRDAMPSFIGNRIDTDNITKAALIDKKLHLEQEASKENEAKATSEADLRIKRKETELRIQRMLTKEIDLYEKNATAKAGANYDDTLKHMKALRAESIIRMHNTEWQINKDAEGHKAQKDALNHYKLRLEEIENQWQAGEITQKKRVELINTETLLVAKVVAHGNTQVAHAKELGELDVIRDRVQNKISNEMKQQIKHSEELIASQRRSFDAYARASFISGSKASISGKVGARRDKAELNAAIENAEYISKEVQKKTGGIAAKAAAENFVTENEKLSRLRNSGQITKEHQADLDARIADNTKRQQEIQQLGVAEQAANDAVHAQKMKMYNQYRISADDINNTFKNGMVQYADSVIDQLIDGTIKWEQTMQMSLANIGKELLKMAANKAISSLFGAIATGGLGGGSGGSLISKAFKWLGFANGTSAHGVRGYASGSGMQGVGSDTIPAMLSPGEIVLNRNASDLFRETMGRRSGGGNTIIVNTYPSLLGSREELLSLDSALANPSIKNVRARR